MRDLFSRPWSPGILLMAYGLLVALLLVESPGILALLGARPSDFAFWITALVEGLGFLGLGLVELTIFLTRSQQKELQHARLRVQDVVSATTTERGEGTLLLSLRNTGRSVAVDCKVLLTLLPVAGDGDPVRQVLPWQGEIMGHDGRLNLPPNAPAFAELLTFGDGGSGEPATTIAGSVSPLSCAKHLGWIDIFSETSIGESLRIEVTPGREGVAVEVDREPFVWPEDGAFTWQRPRRGIRVVAGYSARGGLPEPLERGGVAVEEVPLPVPTPVPSAAV
ncbi:MAG: hypothetical protein KGI98_00810 [Euryarchaeota archaeon]|nr:hypothetical protein [Euryarchaeota archaeon]